MLCALSGHQAKDPVVSPKSGAIFEKTLIESYIATAGKDPITDQPLSAEELVPITSKVPVITPPKPLSYSSIPSMLSAFQNEWDALALEVFTLRKQLHNTREELSVALYRYDAAVRVAARAIKERDEAQQALTQLSESFAVSGDAKTHGQPLVETGAAEASGEPSEKGALPVEELSQAREELFSLHKSTKLTLPVTAKSAVSIEKSEALVGIDNISAMHIDTSTAQTILQGTFGTVLLPAGASSADAVQKYREFTASGFLHDDTGARAFAVDDSEMCMLDSGDIVKMDIAGLRSIVTHPSRPYFVAITDTNSWVFAGAQGPLFTSTAWPSIDAFDLHVDGMLLGVAHGAHVDIVDVTTTQSVSTIDLGSMLKATQIQFAYNGYWLVVGGVTAEDTGLVTIYDLRKNSVVHSFASPEPSEFALDPSCQVLVTNMRNSGKLQVHLFAKKGKKWTANAAESACGPLHHLQVESTAAQLKETGRAKFAGLCGDAVVHYEICFN